MHELASQTLFEGEIRQFTERLARGRGWIFHKLEYPVIDCEFKEDGRTPLRLQFLCDNWNELPPAITLLAANGEILSALSPNPTGVFNSSAHPSTGRPFVCMRGSREYHTHPSHKNDSWEHIKNLPGYKLGGILTQLWRAWQKGTS